MSGLPELRMRQAPMAEAKDVISDDKYIAMLSGSFREQGVFRRP